MTKLNEITGKAQSIPRSVLWLGVAVLGIGSFLLWDGKIRELSNNWSRQADRIEANVRTVRNASQLGDQLKGMSETITSVGAVDIPGSLAEGSNELNRTINELLKKYRVSDDSLVIRPEGWLGGKNVLPEVTKGRKRVQTVRGDLDFIATVEDATSIIAALEADPAVELVRSVRLNRTTAGKVKVRVILEAWVLSDRK